MIPQIIYIVLTTIGFGSIAKEKGKEKQQKFSISFFATVLTHLLYYWGGLYNEFKWPQFSIVLISAIYLGGSAYKDGDTYIKKGITVPLVMMTAVYIALLYLGGFFNPIINAL